MPRSGRAEEAIKRILNGYERRRRPIRGDPFSSLVRIVLSQNTNYRNETMAYERLERTIGVTPETVSKASVEQIAEAIRPAGMHNQRSRTLKKLSEVVLNRYDGDISPILHGGYPEARRELMELPGVGKKTADVLLLFDGGKAIIPVDRHIFRISRRLQLVPFKEDYDEVRRVLEAATEPGRREDAHVILIRFGREICKARRPRCAECFLNDICPYPNGEKD